MVNKKYTLSYTLLLQIIFSSALRLREQFTFTPFRYEPAAEIEDEENLELSIEKKSFIRNLIKTMATVI